MNSTVNFQTIHPQNIEDFSVSFAPVATMEDITVFRLALGNNNFSIFFRTEEDARVFATEVWLAWADFMMKSVDAEAVTGA